MKIEILATSKDNIGNFECPTHIKITAENGEVVEISVEDDSCSNFQYTPYLDFNHSKD